MFFIILQGGLTPCFIFGCDVPHITLVQQENQLYPLRFSAWIYPQPGNFHEVHCKRAWLASHIFVVLKPTHITPVRKKKCFSVCFIVTVCFTSLCTLWSLCVFEYIQVLFTYIYIYFYLTHNAELFFCYLHMNLCNRAGFFHLLLPSV